MNKKVIYSLITIFSFIITCAISESLKIEEIKYPLSNSIYGIIIFIGIVVLLKYTLTFLNI